MNEILQKSSKKFNTKYNCKECDYHTNRFSQYERHLQTKKHKTYTDLQTDLQKSSYTCDCGKSYNHRQSLNKHKKTCTYTHQEQVTHQETIEPSTHKSME